MITPVPSLPFKPWDNPHNLIDHATSLLTETIINVGFFPPIVIIGVVTNILNMIIYAKQGLKDRINVILFSLALADCGYLISLFTYKAFSILTLISQDVGDYWKVRSLNTVIGVYWGFSSTSNLLTMVVAVDRCICVASPLHAKQLLSTRLVVIVIVIVYVVIISGSMIFNVKFDVGMKLDPQTNHTVYSAVLSKFYINNKVWVDVIYNYILAISIPFISLVGVALSTIVTVICLRRAAKWKEHAANTTIGNGNQSSSNDRKEIAVTQMLLLVCYVYIFCITPSVVNAFVVQFVDGWLPTGKYSNTFYLYVAIMHLLSAICSTVNFFIYYSRGTKFRATFWEMFSCCKLKRGRGGGGRVTKRGGAMGGAGVRGGARGRGGGEVGEDSTTSVMTLDSVQSVTDMPGNDDKF